MKLWIPVVFATGCLFYFSFSVEPWLFYGLIPLFMGGAGMLVIRHFFPVCLGKYHVCCLFFLLGSGFCLAWCQTHRQEPFYRLPTHGVSIQGKVRQVEILANGKKRLSLGQVNFLTFPESEQKSWKRLIRFTLLHSDQQIVHTGDIIRVKVRLTHPFPPVRMGDYDLQFYAWFHNIGAYGYALAPLVIIHSGHENSLRLLRERIVAHIAHVLPDSSGAVAQILLTGIGSGLSTKDRHDFAVSGLAHLLAIAGLHLGTVMLIFGGVVRWLLLRSEYLALHWPIKTIALLSGWGAGCFYLLLTGSHVPAVRSLMMASLVVLAILCNRQAVSMHNLMLVALFMLIGSPALVLTVSFQMSMVAVMVLIAGYRYGHVLFFKKTENWHNVRIMLFYIGESAWISLLAGLAVCPVVMAHFHELDLYFVLANLIAVPLTIFWILPIGLLSLFAMIFGLDWFFLPLMGYGIDLVLYTARKVSQFPHAVIYVQNMPAWGLVLYFLGVCVLCLWVTRIRLVGTVFIFIGFMSCLLGTTPDLVTSADGQMIGIRQGGKLWLVCQRGCNPTVVRWSDDWNSTGWKTVAGLPARL